MKISKAKRTIVSLVALLGLTAYGCTRAPQKTAPPQIPEVHVAIPVVRDITDFEEFPGRTEAVKTITVRARVSGYLERVLFKEGAEVKAGDRLFEIDRRTYQADCDRASANLSQAKAHLFRLESDFRRASSLLPTRAISQAEFDQTAGDRAEADAAVRVAEAALHTAALNLDFTNVTAPLSGRISRQWIDPGNLARADDTALTTIVSQDPIYAYFDVDERTTLRIRRLVVSGKVRSAREYESKVFLGLADEKGFPHAGTINFIDNQVDAATGTLRLRGIFPNADQILSPGLFVRIHVPIGEPHRSLLVSERALNSDQGDKFVYVVNVDGEVAYRRVEVGALRDGLRVIQSGLDPGERVVLSGLQRIRPKAKVISREIAMTDREPESYPGAVVGATGILPVPGAGATGILPVPERTAERIRWAPDSVNPVRSTGETPVAPGQVAPGAAPAGNPESAYRGRPW
jgi:RND family efflux transporter MFP subunit